MVPDTADVGTYLLAVGFAHVIHSVGLASALVGVVLRTDEVDVDIEFVKQVLVEHHLAADTTPFHHSGWMERDAVADGGQVEGILGVGVGVGDHRFATGLEVDEGVAYFLALSPVGRRT